MNHAWDTCCASSLESIWFERKQKHHPKNRWSISSRSANSLNPSITPGTADYSLPCLSATWAVSCRPPCTSPTRRKWFTGANSPPGCRDSCQTCCRAAACHHWGSRSVSTFPSCSRLSLGASSRAFRASSPWVGAHLTSEVLS